VHGLLLDSMPADGGARAGNAAIIGEFAARPA